jgi:hypothetical protein
MPFTQDEEIRYQFLLRHLRQLWKDLHATEVGSNRWSVRRSQAYLSVEAKIKAVGVEMTSMLRAVETRDAPRKKE